MHKAERKKKIKTTCRVKKYLLLKNCVNLKKKTQQTINTSPTITSTVHITQLYKLYFTFDVFCLLECNVVKLQLQLHMKKLIFKDGGVTEPSLCYLQ